VVAVQLAFDESQVEMEELGLRVSDEGMTVEDPDGSKARCAMRWKDMGALQDRIVERLTGAAAR
jgi:hypothetical protein